MPPNLDQKISTVMRGDVTVFPVNLTVSEALARIRTNGLGERIVYFYVVDDLERLVGVLPTRRLLTSDLSVGIESVMISPVIAIPVTATVMEACECFVLHRLLAFPVVDKQRKVMGTVDVSLLTEEVLDRADDGPSPPATIPPEEPIKREDAFEAIGFRVWQVKEASPLRGFRFRFPWLLATVASGFACAIITGAFSKTLEKSLLLAFFLPLVLGLGESVAIQSMTVTVQALRSLKPTWKWYFGAFAREVGTAVFLGLGCASLVSLGVWIWRGDLQGSLIIGASIVGALCIACLIGLTVPTALHAVRLDPKIAAGPVALALADLCTVLVYFIIALCVLG